MRRYYPSLSSTAALASLLCLTACSGDDVKTSASSTSSASATTDATSTSGSTTSGSSSTSDATSSSSTSGSETSSTSGSSSTSDATSSSGSGGGLPDGDPCVGDQECASGHCYVVAFLGGSCGECAEDSDCAEGGCSAPNPFASAPSMCNMGEVGGGCQTDEVCMPGLKCATVVSVLALIELITCSECVTDADCEPGELCAPNASVSGFSGQNECITPGAMPLDAYCDIKGSGDTACMSGFCSPINVMDLDEIGACGECKADADCDGGTCEFGAFSAEDGTLLGSRCV